MKKRSNHALTALCIILLIINGCAPAIKNLDSGGTEIICFGDSITYGSVERGDDYPTYLSELLGEEVINAGIGGATTEDALKRLESDVLSRDPYLVIVEFGANDYLRDLPKDKAIENLRTIISRIQEEGSMTALCDASGGSSILGAFDIYHKDMKKLARETGSIFIPHVMKGVIQNTSLKVDRFHPNAEGNKIIAERVYVKIKPYLKEEEE